MKCCCCSSTNEELRPYGPGGAPICIDCAMSTPERQAETSRQICALIENLPPGSVVLLGDGPPVVFPGTVGETP